MKPGFKQTEVGVIPEDWDTPELWVILKSMQLGGNYANSNRETPWPLIKMGNLARGRIKLEKLEFVRSAQPPAARDRLQEDNVLFNTRNTLDLVGKVAIWRGELPEAYFNSNILRMGFDHARVSSNRFMNYVLNTPQSIKSLRGLAIGTTSVAAIYSRDLRKLKVPLPKKAEQKAIAEVLSDADSLIGSLEQLLAKKRDIKQGAMQELLSGKRRLPGFTGEWQVTRLGELGSTFGGLVGKNKLDFGHGASRYITFLNIMRNVVIDCSAFELVDVKRTESQNKVAKGDFFFNGSSETPEEVGMCAVLTDDVHNVFLNSFCFGFRFYEGAPGDGLYLAYYFRSREGRELLKSLAQGATRYNLSKTALLKVCFPLPKLREQAAIARFLSDMDVEITALEGKLGKTRNLKQGMMQELLTGQIRLV